MEKSSVHGDLFRLATVWFGLQWWRDICCAAFDELGFDDHDLRLEFGVRWLEDVACETCNNSSYYDVDDVCTGTGYDLDCTIVYWCLSSAVLLIGWMNEPPKRRSVRC
jgi:hypothetical protein